jgi:hypothetical protein
MAQHDLCKSNRVVPGLCLRPSGLAWHDPFQIRAVPGPISAGTNLARPGPGWLDGQI